MNILVFKSIDERIPNSAPLRTPLLILGVDWTRTTSACEARLEVERHRWQVESQRSPNPCPRDLERV